MKMKTHSVFILTPKTSEKTRNKLFLIIIYIYYIGEVYKDFPLWDLECFKRNSRITFMFYDSLKFEQCSRYMENLPKICKHLSFSEIKSLAMLPNFSKYVLLLCTYKIITQFNQVCVIVALR